MKKKTIALNAVLNGLRNILNIIFPVITFPYVARILSVKGLGNYNFSNSFVAYFILLAGLGVSTYAVREGAKYRNNQREIDNFASQVFSINMIATAISYVILAIIIMLSDKIQNYTVCILIFSIQILFTTIGTEWVYVIFENYTYITIRSIVFKIISVILLFIFVRKQGDYLNYAWITVFSSVGSNILNYIHVKKFCNVKFTFKIDWTYHMKPIMIIFASSIATTIYLNLDTTLLGIMKNNYVVGIYSVSTKIYDIVKKLVASIIIVTIPRFSFLWGKRNFSKFRNLLLDMSDFLLMLAIPVTVGTYMLAPQIVTVLSSDKYLRSVTSLRLLCPALFFSIFSWVLSSCVLIPTKKEQKVLLVTIFSASINVLLNLIFIPKFAENSAAVTTSLSEFISVILYAYYSYDVIKGLYSNSSFLKNVLTYSIGTLGIVMVCVVMTIISSSDIYQIIFSILLSMIVYGLILIFTKNRWATYFFNNVIK